MRVAAFVGALFAAVAAQGGCGGSITSNAVYNWDNLDSVPVDVSGFLAAGASYELFDVQDLFGSPVSSGVYSGGTLAVPMTHRAVAAAVGNVPAAITHTSKEFGAFLLRASCP